MEVPGPQSEASNETKGTKEGPSAVVGDEDTCQQTCVCDVHAGEPYLRATGLHVEAEKVGAEIPSSERGVSVHLGECKGVFPLRPDLGLEPRVMRKDSEALHEVTGRGLPEHELCRSAIVSRTQQEAGSGREVPEVLGACVLSEAGQVRAVVDEQAGSMRQVCVSALSSAQKVATASDGMETEGTPNPKGSRNDNKSPIKVSLRLDCMDVSGVQHGVCVHDMSLDGESCADEDMCMETFEQYEGQEWHLMPPMVETRGYGDCSACEVTCRVKGSGTRRSGRLDANSQTGKVTDAQTASPKSGCAFPGGGVIQVEQRPGEGISGQTTTTTGSRTSARSGESPRRTSGDLDLPGGVGPGAGRKGTPNPKWRSINEMCHGRNSRVWQRPRGKVSGAGEVRHRLRTLRGLPVEVDLTDESNGPASARPDSEMGEPEQSASAQPEQNSGASGSAPPSEVREPVVSGPPHEPSNGGSQDVPDEVPLEDMFGSDIQGRALEKHLSQGHWPYSNECPSCRKARGRIPARRRETDDHFSVGVDFLFFGRHIRVLLMIVIGTSMMFCSVIKDDHATNVRHVVEGLIEIGAGGKQVELVGDQDDTLVKLFRDAGQAVKFPGLGTHWRQAPLSRPQAKAHVERGVRSVKEGFYAVWLDLESSLGCRIALEAPLFEFAIQYVVRTYNICHQPNNSTMTPLDRMRNQAGSKRPETFPFGVLGYGKPPNVARYRGMRLVPMVYLGPKSSTGCGLLGLPLEIVGPESERRIDVFSAFRPGRPLEWKKETLEPLCIPPRMNQEGGYPALPSTKFLKRRRSEDGPERPEDVPESPMIAPEEPVPLEGPGEGEMDLDDESMYEPSESGGMQIDDGDLEDMLIESLHRQLYLEFMSDERLRFIEGMPSVTMDTAVSWFEVMFGGEQVVVLVPDGVVDEMTNEKLQHEQVHEGMKTEVESLEKLRVGQVVDEKTAKRLAAEAGVKILGSRWVISQKTPEIVRCRLVVKDFRTYGGPALLEGIYSPTSTVEALRFVLAYGAEYKCHFAGLDVSTAFMYAPLKEGERAVVRLPSSVVRKRGDRAFLSLSKAMNGLRQGPLRWYEELTNTLMENHAEPTFEATLFRMEFEGGYSGLVLVYVDDVLVCAQLKWHCDVVVELLQSRYQVKRTGDLFPEQIGQLKFLGRTIARLCQAGPICLGLETEYLEGVIRSFGERLKPNETLPDLERLYDKESKKYQGKDKSAATLTAEAYQRYRKVLGQLAWASITRSDLQYCVGFLSRYQQNPDQFAESCMRAILRWLLSRLTVVQTFPSENVEWEFANGPCEQIMGYCDASWNLSSVTGFLLFWRGSMLKSGSRKQAVPALSSPEAEVVALAESAKEGLSMACLVETALYGIKKTILGEPEQPISQIQVVLKTDSTSAQCIAQMKGLLRKVRHLQLRVVFLQHLVDSGQLVTRRIPGKENPADGLTKTMTHEMMQNLCSAAGLISLDKFPEKANLMNRKDTPSPKNLLGTSEVSDKEATPTPKDACPRQEGPQPQDLKVWSTAIAATTTKTRHAGHVKFDKVEIFEIDFASRC
ncbi:unnamed protein product [Effrenium voratum]|nr:unnamed protein product [Effrenium voratum]CAJ1429595.1 unnamed protein product [Effrenium voratum]